MALLLIATEHLQHRKSPTNIFMISLTLFTLNFRSPPALMTVASMKNPLCCLLLAQLLVLGTVVVISVRAQTDGCGLDLTSFLPAPYRDSSSQICKPVWNSFILRYSQTKDNVLTLVLSAVYEEGWIGMGFSKYGMMVGSSAMVGWIGRDSRARIKQYLLNGTSPLDVVVDKGELQNTTVPPTVILYGDTIYMAFQLQFPAPITHQPLIFAFGTARPILYQLTPHDNQVTINFDFTSGTSAVVPSYPGHLKRTHGLLAISGWGFLLPIGALIARYFRFYDPMWFYLHTVIQFVGFIVGFAAVVTGIELYGRLNAHVPAHRGLGIFVLFLSILQIIAFFIRPDKDAKVRRYWNWYHSWVGRLALFLAAVNIVLGIKVGGAGNGWKVGYSFNLAIILITVIVLELVLWTGGSRKGDAPDARVPQMK